jgi:HTH-type transcriptional regulator/antitoxin HigA
MINPSDIIQIPSILKKCGVRLVFVESLPKAGIDGVCTWINGSPVIGMAIRYDRIDNFWFVLRHEIEHVLQEHGKEEIHIDELDGKNANYDDSVSNEEKIANKAATEFCVPISELSSFIARKHPFIAEKDVIGFAKRMQVHPGIIVGQIHKRTNKYDVFRRYLVKIRQHLQTTNIMDGWGSPLIIPL